MPIYEYRCAKCGRVSSFLVRNVAAHSTPSCPRCGHATMQRVFSRVAVIGGRKGRTTPATDSPPPALGSEGEEGDRGEAGGDQPSGPEPSTAEISEMEALLGSIDENDPRSMGRAMRRMAEMTHEPLDGEMEEVVRRLEAGEDPEKIEEQMDGPGGDSGEGGDELYDG